MSHPRVVLDTNVLISAILFGGPPGRILDLVIAGRVRCCVSLPILDELRDVLQRRKIGFTAEQAQLVIEELHGVCDLVTPTVTIRAVIADPDDDRVLECAVAAAADAIVSGDSDQLSMGSFERVRILSPADFLAGIGAHP